jgi:hypothetical protein
MLATTGRVTQHNCSSRLSSYMTECDEAGMIRLALHRGVLSD